MARERQNHPKKSDGYFEKKEVGSSSPETGNWGVGEAGGKKTPSFTHWIFLGRRGGAVGVFV